MVSVGFPEAGGVGVHEADASDPFSGFPEVEVGDDHSDGSAMGRVEGCAVESVGEHRFAVNDVGGWQIGGVAAVAVGHEEFGRVVDAGVGQEVVDEDASPVGVEFAPLCDAVDVGVDVGLWESHHLVPVPDSEVFAVVVDAEGPCGGVDARSWAC